MKRFLTMLFVVGLFSLIPVTTWAISGADLHINITNKTSKSLSIVNPGTPFHWNAYLTDPINDTIEPGKTKGFRVEKGTNDDAGYYIFAVVDPLDKESWYKVFHVSYAAYYFHGQGHAAGRAAECINASFPQGITTRHDIASHSDGVDNLFGYFKGVAVNLASSIGDAEDYEVEGNVSARFCGDMAHCWADGTYNITIYDHTKTHSHTKSLTQHRGKHI